MFVGRYCVVALGWLLLLHGAPLGATEPAGKIAEAARPPEAACPDEATPPASADKNAAEDTIQYFIESRVGSRPATADDDADSHRRHAQDKSHQSDQTLPPRLVRTVDDPSVHPTERIRGQVTRDDFLYHTPRFIDRPTLAEAIRRLAGCGDSCPLCGTPNAAEANIDGGTASRSSTSDRPIMVYHRLARQAGDGSPQELRAGEPAQVILDTQKRLGKSVLEGTEFSGSPELLIQWIRALDEENRRRQAAQPATSPYESIEVALEDDLPVTTHSQIVALREACRQLQEAADLLEDQNLFESADALRAAADDLRGQSREKVSESEQASQDAE